MMSRTERQIKLDQREEEIIEEMSNGKSIKEIADEKGCSTANVSSALKKYRIRNNISIEEWETFKKEVISKKEDLQAMEIIEKMWNGKTISEIANEYGYSNAKVNLILKKYRRRNHISNEEWKVTTKSAKTQASILKVDQQAKEIIEELLNGKNVLEIAKERGCHNSNIYCILKRYRRRNNISNEEWKSLKKEASLKRKTNEQEK